MGCALCQLSHPRKFCRKLLCSAIRCGGRAIRIWPGHPDKTSNIWHLVAIKPYKNPVFSKEDQEELDLNPYQDLQTPCRRMDHFLGLSYKEDTIETGLDRLNFPEFPFKKKETRRL